MTAQPSTIRLAHVDDHEAMRVGFGAIVAREPDLELVASGSAVDEVLPVAPEVDLVVLDLRLGDGSTPEANVRRLIEAGARVLGFSAAEDPVSVRQASIAGALGIVRKTEPVDVLLESLRAAARGELIATVDWAAALDGDPRLADVGLSPKETRILELYASGEKSVTVAARTGLSEKTVAEYVRRIRIKYARVGRPAPSRIDLYKRAVEDGVVDGLPGGGGEEGESG